MVTPPEGGAAVPLIELRDVRKHYGGGAQPAVEVLHGVSLKIFAGEFVALVGASGSGKSTLMNLLGCLDRPSSGAYLFEGEDVAGFDADRLAALRRDTFGFVFQGYHLITRESARENVEMPAIYAGMPAAQRTERALQLLERLGLQARQDYRPHQLSGGQQQRVSIARALMNGGRIILADEPTGALDSKSGAEVLALLRELAAAGHTVILITHDRSVAAQAQRVVEIHDGNVVADSGHRVGEKGEENATVATAPQTPRAIDRTAGNTAGLTESLRSSWRGMRASRVRTSLTLLGIVIGVASVIVMLAVGEGARRRVIEQMGTLGTAIMYMGSSAPATGGPRGELTPEDLEAVAELPSIRRVMPVIGNEVTVRRGSVDREVYVFAANQEMPAVHHWKVAQGRYYSEAEDRDLAPLAVLGHKAREHFFPDDASPLGKQLLIGSSPFEVVGVMAERGADSGAQDYDQMVFIPYRSGRARVYQAMTQPDYVVLEAASPADVVPGEAAVRRLLTARHGGREDFAIGNAAARLQAESATRRSLSVMLGLVAAVSLVVGGIGVMNVMLMTVRERTREIGIRMAVGARRADIQRQFLAESALMTVLGGVAGVLVSLVIGTALVLSGVAVVFSIAAILGAFAFAVVTGVVFGWMPARSAARLDPVVALVGE